MNLEESQPIMIICIDKLLLEKVVTKKFSREKQPRQVTLLPVWFMASSIHVSIQEILPGETASVVPRMRKIFACSVIGYN